MPSATPPKVSLALRLVLLSPYVALCVGVSLLHSFGAGLTAASLVFIVTAHLPERGAKA